MAEQVPVIFVTGETAAERLDELKAIAPQADIRHFDPIRKMEREIGDADIIGGPVSSRALARAGKLKWVHSWHAGPNKQLFPEFIASDILLTCSKGNGAIPLAEHAMMLMLMLNREAMRWIKAQRWRRWKRHSHGELNGLTCGIIGTGYSGADLALKAKAFHMRVVGMRRQNVPAPNFDKMYSRDQIIEFVKECDFLVVTAPLTPETKGMLGEAEFRAMKPTAHYICFSRGGLADDAVLYRALKEKWIAGAGLDAHDVEPLPITSPFWGLSNAIITPHNGATSWKTPIRGFEIFADNLARYQRDEPLINVVDKIHGY